MTELSLIIIFGTCTFIGGIFLGSYIEFLKNKRKGIEKHYWSREHSG